MKITLGNGMKYIPYTMETFKQHREKWFSYNGAKELLRIESYNKKGVVFDDFLVTYEELITAYTHENGDTCGTPENKAKVKNIKNLLKNKS